MKIIFFLLTFIVIALILTTFSVSADEPEDEITVKGTILKGRIISFGDHYIEFETVYGLNAILISYDDVEQIKTQKEYPTAENEEIENLERIVELKEKQLLASKEKAEKDETQNSDNKNKEGSDKSLSFIERMHLKYPHWKGNMDIGLRFEDDDTKEREIEVSLKIQRRKRPTRFVLKYYMDYETEKSKNKPKETTEDEFDFLLFAEYDLTDHYYLFALPAAERDNPDGIKRRTFPSTGVGYYFFETDSGVLQAQLGVGYIKEKFTDFEDNSYTAAHFGTKGDYTFRNKMELGGILLYYPSLTDLGEDWLFRGNLYFSIPFTDFLSLKLNLINIKGRFTVLNFIVKP